MQKTNEQHKLLLKKPGEFLARAPEIAIFGVCCVMVDELRDLQYAFSRGELTFRVFLEKSNTVLLQFAHTAAATERFEVIAPVTNSVHFSPFFWRWFNWWDDYFRSLTPAQISEIEALARERLPAANDYRPP